SSSTMQGAGEVIRVARELNPKLVIFARSTYLRELAELREAGADVVVSGEGEVALSMTEFLLRELGATPEQLDRGRARIRWEFFVGAGGNGQVPDDRMRPPGDDESVAAQAEDTDRRREGAT